MLVNIHQAKSQLSQLLQAVERGIHVTIARNGVPVADLLPHRTSHKDGKKPRLRTLGVLATAEWYLADDWQDTPPEMFGPLTHKP